MEVLVERRRDEELRVNVDAHETNALDELEPGMNISVISTPAGASLSARLTVQADSQGSIAQVLAVSGLDVKVASETADGVRVETVFRTDENTKIRRLSMPAIDPHSQGGAETLGEITPGTYVKVIQDADGKVTKLIILPVRITAGRWRNG
jgi:hypothetical protein